MFRLSGGVKINRLTSDTTLHNNDTQKLKQTRYHIVTDNNNKVYIKGANSTYMLWFIIGYSLMIV